jgi:hypothetical protein
VKSSSFAVPAANRIAHRLVLQPVKRFTETLEMDDFSFAQKNKYA